MEVCESPGDCSLVAYCLDGCAAGAGLFHSCSFPMISQYLPQPQHWLLELSALADPSRFVDEEGFEPSVLTVPRAAFSQSISDAHPVKLWISRGAFTCMTLIQEQEAHHPTPQRCI